MKIAYSLITLLGYMFWSWLARGDKMLPGSGDDEGTVSMPHPLPLDTLHTAGAAELLPPICTYRPDAAVSVLHCPSPLYSLLY